LPGIASSDTSSFCPDLHLLQIDFGNPEVDLQRIDRLQVDHVLPFLHVIAERDRAQADEAGKGGLDFSFGKPRRGERHRGFHHFQAVLGFVACLPRNEPLFLQIDGAVVLRLRERQVGLRLQDLGFIDRGVELDEHRALGDRAALLESDRRDAAGHFRTQSDGFVGAQAADRGDGLRHRCGRRRDGLDHHRLRTAAAFVRSDGTT
jgi:hypothetical protein